MTNPIRWCINHYASVASTMDQAAALARFGAAEGTVVVSDRQTAGRGRGGRSWQAPPASGLFCTVVLRPPVPPERLPMLPLITGVAVSEALELLTGAAVRLKWPNDIWLGDDPEHQKVAGILTTSRLTRGTIEHVLIGIGINLSSRAAELPAGATSVLLATGSAPSPREMLWPLLHHFEERYLDYLQTGGRASLAPWRQRAALLGERVIVTTPDGDRAGVFVGIDDDGPMLLEAPRAGTSRIIAGDLTRGPRAATITAPDSRNN